MTGEPYLFALCSSGFLDLFGVSMIMQLIQPEARDLGASATLAGILGSVYGCLQFFSSPVFGQWSDLTGRRISLCVSLGLAGCAYGLLGLYPSLVILFAGRVLLGCFKHSQTVSKAFLSEVLPIAEHSSALGTFNSMSSVGIILGPIVGGHIAERAGFSTVAAMVCCVFVLNASLVWWSLPALGIGRDNKSVKSSQEDSASLKHSDTSYSLKTLGSDEISFSPKTLLKSVRDFDWPNLWDLMAIRFCVGFSMIIFRTNFTMVLKQKFSASPTTIGYMTSFSGVIATLAGFVMGYITKKFPNPANLLQVLTFLQSLTILALSLAPSLWILLVCLTPLNIISAVSRVTGTSLMVQRTGGSNVGSAMGFSQSVMSIARILAPFIAGVAQEYSVDAASFISAIAALAGVGLMVLRPQDLNLRTKKTS